MSTPYSTIGGMTLKGTWPSTWGTSGTLGIYCTSNFTADDGQAFQAGDGESLTGEFVTKAAISVSSNVGTVASFLLPKTDAGTPTSTRYFARVFTSTGAATESYPFENFHLRTSIGDSPSYLQWWLDNQQHITPQPDGAPSTSAMNAAIAAALLNAALNQDYVISTYSTFAIAVAAMPATGATLVINQATSVPSNISVPSYVTLRFTGKGYLNLSTGITCTILGPVEADPVKIFYNAVSGQGTISFSGNNKFSQIYPEWWGAIADGSTDCLAAINSAKGSFTNNQPGINGGIVKLGFGDYHVSGTISITDQQVHIIGSGGPGVLGSTATASTFISSTANAPIIKYAYSADVYSFRARLENLTVLGSVTAGSSQHGVWVDNNGILTNNVGVEKTGGHGLYLTWSSSGGYSNMEISSTVGDGIRIDYAGSANVGAGAHGNIFHRVSIFATAATGDAIGILHGLGNSFYGVDLENNLGRGVHVRYVSTLEPQNNHFYDVWNENSAMGDLISNQAQYNSITYTHYTSPAPTITGNNTFREAGNVTGPVNPVDREQYLLLGASETTLYPIISRPGAPTVGVSAGPGLTGAYIYNITFETAVGETDGGTASATVNPVNQTIALTNIPLGPIGTVRRCVYRTTNGGSSYFYVDRVNDNTTTTFNDTTADGALGRAIPLFNGSGSRIQLDGDGNMAQFGTSATTTLIGPQRSDLKWPNYGFQARSGYGLNMMATDRVSLIGGEVEGLSIDSFGIANARVGLKVGSGTTVTKYLSNTASLDYAAWVGGGDDQDKTITVTGAVDGDVVVLGLPNTLASIAGVSWKAWVSGADTVTVRGTKFTAGASANPIAATVRVSVFQH